MKGAVRRTFFHTSKSFCSKIASKIKSVRKEIRLTDPGRVLYEGKNDDRDL